MYSMKSVGDGVEDGSHQVELVVCHVSVKLVREEVDGGMRGVRQVPAPRLRE